MKLKTKEEREAAKQYILKEFVENEIIVMSGKPKRFCYLDQNVSVFLIFLSLVISYRLKLSLQSYYFSYVSETNPTK